MSSHHTYAAHIRWTGNKGAGTADCKTYSRDHDMEFDHGLVVPGTADPAFLGDPARLNPEQMLVASLSACHMLWYLHLCSQKRIVVSAYEDRATGEMAQDASGGGRFVRVDLKPFVTLADETRTEAARALHEAAHEKCFIARSVNFDVHLAPEFATSRTGSD